jgi:flagellar biogenesis protein FliO
LEQPAILGCKPAVLPGPAARAASSKDADTKKKRTVKTNMLRDRGVPSKGPNVAGMTKAKKARKARTTTKTSNAPRLVATKAVEITAETVVLDKPTATPILAPQEQALPQSVNECGAETNPDLVLTVSPEMHLEAKVGVPDMSCEEMVLDAPGAKEPEALNDSVEMPQSTGTMLQWVTRAWNWVRKQLGSRQSRRRLRVCESVSLGEKRFVAVIEIDGEQFLVGGASSSVATLARLEPSQEFSAVLKRRWAQDPVQA